MKTIFKFVVVFFVIASISIWARPPRGKRHHQNDRNERHKACKDNISKFCSSTKPGEGRMRDCLEKNKDKLSEGCRKAHNF
ncbi:MAG: cysteine rich repeat-containing protein [Leptospiraceae bacterium]|nr:hypothetical protein [Leptospiraceae bacterium]MCK6381231.1 cysteine rich repeat-containing protein [Leptospiraceae bacterium]NUM40754.1 hypothetical protein [Leptospiraceae bacterium]